MLIYLYGTKKTGALYYQDIKEDMFDILFSNLKYIKVFIFIFIIIKFYLRSKCYTSLLMHTRRKGVALKCSV